MKYADMRDNIKSGDVLAWSHRSWKTWYDIKIQLVRFFTQSEYCHVGVAWVIAGRVFVIESVIPKIRIVPLSNELPFYWVPMSAPWKPETEEFAMSLVGVGTYSQLEAIAAGMGQQTSESSGKWECAKFVQACLTRDGFAVGDVHATPTDLVFKLQQLGKSVSLLEED